MPSETASFGGLFMSLFVFAPRFLGFKLPAVVRRLRPVQLPLLVFFPGDFTAAHLLLSEHPLGHEIIEQVVVKANGNALMRHGNINALWRSMRYSIVAIGRFLSVRRWVKQRMAQICLTTAELALHYGGLGAGSPTSEVQEVKRLHCLPMQIVLLLPCLLQWFPTMVSDKLGSGEQGIPSSSILNRDGKVGKMPLSLAHHIRLHHLSFFMYLPIPKPPCQTHADCAVLYADCAVLYVGLSNILDSEGREDVSGSGPMKRTHGTGVAPTLVGS